MIQRIKVSVFLFLIIGLFACKKSSLAPAVDFKYNYYPLSLTKVLIYDVDSTAYDGFANTTKNFKFQIKDSVADTFIDDNNRQVFRVERYKKIADVWKFHKTITRLLSARSAEETIDNKTYIRLVFPAEIDTYWDVNSKNNLGYQETYTSEIFDTFSINSLTFNETINTYSENKNLLREDVQTNIYSRDVGLISSDIRAVDLKIETGKIVNGFVYTMKIVSYK
jgi:hypothetical protein